MHRWLLVVGLAALVGACALTPGPTPARPLTGVTAEPPPPLAVVATPTPAPARLALSATGLGPCDEPWYVTCEYGIRLEDAGSSDRRGTFTWDEGTPKGLAHGTAGPVGSTGVSGDIPATLPPGRWTLSFRLFHGSDAISFNPVPGGTPRYAWEDPFTAACTTTLTVSDQPAVDVRVAFDQAACTVTAVTAPSGAKLTLDATGLGPCPVTFPLSCRYVIRLEGTGEDHVGWFAWHDGKTPGPSIWVVGDVPAFLPPGTWTFSFGRVEASDVVSFVPVPDGTPRTIDLQPADVGCRQTVTVTDEIAVGLHVAFTGTTCTITGEAAIP